MNSWVAAHFSEPTSGVTEGGRGGQLPPGAAGKGAQNSLAKNVL